MADRAPSCAECRGACCESFALDLNLDAVHPEIRLWIKHHATSVEGHSLWFECRCTKLTRDGTCAVYDRRPEPCRVFAVGGADCLRTIKERRPLLHAALTMTKGARDG
jgi:Fe-S-cluster containining protein